MKVHFDGRQNAQVFLPEDFNGKTCGFCGNKNGNKDDEWQLGPTCKSDGSAFYGPEVNNIDEHRCLLHQT